MFVVKDKSNFFFVIVLCYFVMVDFFDVEGLVVLIIMFVLGDELVDDVKKFEDNLKVFKYVEIFKDQIYGWMVVRGDLKDERVKKEYERGYKIVVEFFGKNL